MSIGKLGPQNVVTTSPDSDLKEATRTFEEENVGAIAYASSAHRGLF